MRTKYARNIMAIKKKAKERGTCCPVTAFLA
uniref:Uncharacterized protein n=1 Tax=Rhizophora mucronata TaxID=61149 RepID=A0A2P2QYY6_RHIMU